MRRNRRNMPGLPNRWRRTAMIWKSPAGPAGRLPGSGEQRGSLGGERSERRQRTGCPAARTERTAGKGRPICPRDRREAGTAGVAAAGRIAGRGNHQPDRSGADAAYGRGNAKPGGTGRSGSPAQRGGRSAGKRPKPTGRSGSHGCAGRRTGGAGPKRRPARLREKRGSRQ